MKEFAIIVFIALAIGIALAFGQESGFTSTPVQPHSSSGNTYVGGYGGGYHSSTAAEGRLRGMGSLVRSAGQANLDNSGAAINYSIARSNQIQNYSDYVDTYFQMRAANRAYRAAERGPKPTMEQLVRFAQAGKPKPLSPSQLDAVTGAVHWPMVLQTDHFADQRAEVETAFARRASTSAIGYDDFIKLRNVTNSMLDDLKKHVRDVPPDQYMAAKRFLESLSYEAGRPTA